MESGGANSVHNPSTKSTAVSKFLRYLLLGRHVQFGQSAQCGFHPHLPLLLSSYILDYQNSCF